MNNSFPYHIDYPELIPTCKQDAQAALNLLDEFKPDLQSTPKEVFLKGWFAIVFLHIAPHPDDIEEWPDNLEPFVHEAFRRMEASLITEDQVYATDAQQQGTRLINDGDTSCYVVMEVGDNTGYLTANFGEKGNIPGLTGIKAKAYSYDSAQDAAKNASMLNVDNFKIYSSSPEEDLQCSDFVPIEMKQVKDKEVILQREDGLYLYRDGVTWGDCTTKACKFLLQEDNVESQIQQVKEMYGATWKWLDYQTILDNLD